MKSVSSIALGLALALGVAASPAAAQEKAQAQQAPQRKFDLSKEARPKLADLQKAQQAGDAAAYQAALSAAQAAAKTADDRYVIGQIQLSQAIKAKDNAQTIAAIETMLQSGGATQAELPALYRNLGSLSYDAKDYGRANTALTKLLELEPTNTDALLVLSEIRYQEKKPAEAVSTLDRAIAAQKAKGQAVPEVWYRRQLKFAYEGKLAPQTAKASRELMAAYPSPTNWRDGLLIFRQSSDQAPADRMDTLRLMRASKALNSGDEYLALADSLARGRYYAEAKAVIDEGAASGKLTKSNPSAAAILKEVSGRIAEDKAALAGLEGKARSGANGETAFKIGDAYYGHGDYAKAADLYRVALQKGGVDANLVNSRLGMALAQSGRKAEAEAAFKAVKGQRESLASYWLLWLSRTA